VALLPIVDKTVRQASTWLLRELSWQVRKHPVDMLALQSVLDHVVDRAWQPCEEKR
jgi:hypothetical protein